LGQHPAQLLDLGRNGTRLGPGHAQRTRIGTGINLGGQSLEVGRGALEFIVDLGVAFLAERHR
jgi:hypothetical protein